MKLFKGRKLKKETRKIRRESKATRKRTRIAARGKRQEKRQTGREKVLDWRTAKKISKQRQKIQADMEQEPDIAADVLEQPENEKRLQEYVRAAGEQPDPDIEGLSQQAIELRQEQMEDVVPEIYEAGLSAGTEPEEIENILQDSDMV